MKSMTKFHKLSIHLLLILLITNANHLFAHSSHAEGGEYHEGPHHGIIADFSKIGGNQAGFLELKLQNNKGNLEVWLAKDENMSIPFDLPIDSEIKVTFIDKSMRTVKLKVRNSEGNEDENGLVNVREELTNYFIFPETNNRDTRWLTGKKFKSSVVVSFENSGKKYRSSLFTVTPHIHSEKVAPNQTD